MAIAVCGINASVFAALPTVTPGTPTTVCAGNVATMPYTATNSPSTYNITWTGSPAGLRDVPPGTTLPSTTIPIIIDTNCLSGTYSGYITVTNASGSSAPKPISITVNGLPRAYAVTGGGPYCAGASGSHIGISGTDAGILYRVNRGGGPIGTSSWGTGAAMDLGAFTIAGTYTITAQNAVTLCSSTMSGSASITIYSTPPIVTVTGGGNYCEGGAGVPVGLTGSVFGAEYQLYRGSVAIGSPIPGLGMAIDFGPQTISGTYTVIATDTGSPCPVAMTGSATVLAIPAPATFSVTGGGVYCSGSYGVNIGLSGSSVGINYKLYHGSSYVSMLPGTGGPIDFGLTIPAGAYTVRASNSIYGCITNMSDTAYISLLPVVIPDVTITTDAAANTVCDGRTVMFTATGAFPGPNPTYTWSVNGTFAGTGTTYSYVPTNSDNVKVVMTSDATCAVPNIVNDAIFVTVKPATVPTVVLNTFPGTYIINGQYDTINAVVVNGGVAPTYQWYVNGVLVAGATGTRFISNVFKDNDTVECRVMGCASTPGSSFVVIRVGARAGVNSVMGNGSVNIIPNPNKGVFNITGQLSVSNNPVTIKVSDITGRVVYLKEIQTSNGTINANVELTNGVSAGIYVLNIIADGENIVRQISVE